MNATPEVSVLIVNWNTRELVLSCLNALSNIEAELRREVIVVDNGSADGSPEALAGRSDIQLIRNDANLGFAAAVNQAYRASSGPYVLLLNSDAELTAGALRALIAFLDHNPEAAGVGPLYRNPDGSPQPFHFQLPTFTTILINGSSVLRRLIPGSERMLRDYRMLDADFGAARPVPQPSASCLLLRRSCLPPQHILDERYPIFFNDVQLARTIAAAGRDLWVTPEAVVVHEAHSSGRKLGAREGRRIYIGSLIRMLTETEPPSKVLMYRLLVLIQNLALFTLRRPHALIGRDLRRALAGDPGPLPVRPTR